jgi:hypothetical protein
MVISWYGATISNYSQSASLTMLHRFCWGVAGGSITGLQNFLKDALTMLHADDLDRTVTLYLVLFLCLALASAFGGLMLLSACMKLYDATFSAAMFVGSFVVSASIMSAVHYHTFENLSSSTDFVMYPSGIAVLLSGVALLVYGTHEKPQAIDAQ